jgi:putative hydrolases of HD superfamily
MTNNLENLEKIIEFLFQVNKLKETYRYSTVTKFKGDSVASHCWRLSLMVILLVKELKLNVDELRAVKLAITHDLAEAITGDIDFMLVKRGVVKIEDKKRHERAAMEKFKETLPDDLGQEIFDLWEEYEETKTKEAAFVKALDKMEAQTHVLPISEKLDDTETMISYAEPHLEKFPELKPLAEILKNKFKEKLNCL